VTGGSLWKPQQRFELEDVLRTKSLGGVRLDTLDDQIESLLGPSETPVARLGRKSKIWSVQYGNVSIMTEGHRVIAIEMNFERASANDNEVPSIHPPMVDAGRLGAWRRPEWLAYAENSGWTVRDVGGATRLIGDGARVSLGVDGELHVASLQ
jgi:hypothetical protein